MGKRKIVTHYFSGKNLPKTKGGRISMQGEPNSNIDKRNIFDGSFISRRKIGLDGKAIKDMDAAYEKHKNYDHVHDIKDGFRNPNDRKPNKKERREFKKAKRKKKKWKKT